MTVADMAALAATVAVVALALAFHWRRRNAVAWQAGYDKAILAFSEGRLQLYAPNGDVVTQLWALEAAMRQHALSRSLIAQGILLPWANRLAKILDGDTFEATGTVIAGNMMRQSREE